MEEHTRPNPKHKIAYIMKGFPRASEPFISNEIYLLEQMGLGIHVFAIQSLSENQVHSIIGDINTEVTYLPENPEVADLKFWKWLKRIMPQFLGRHFKLILKRPFSYLLALFLALYYSLKFRKGLLSRVKKVFYKDFLRAGYIAAEIVKRQNIRHLHGHFCHGSTTMTLLVSKLTGIPYSFTAHAKDIYLPRLNPGDLLRRKITKAKFVVTCTNANRIHLKQICPEKVSIFTIYHGLDIEHFTPRVESLDDTDVPCILAVGRFVAKKGFRFLVQACRNLKEKGYKFRCQIVGPNGEETDIIRQLVKTFALENFVSLRNAVTQDQLKEIYKECTVFALPCQVVDNGDRDGIPNVLVEAMAMGIPVISTAISGIPELIEDKISGLLVPQKDVNALTDALESLLKNPSLRRKLAEEGRKKVCKFFDHSMTTRGLKELFDSCLSRNNVSEKALA